MYIILVIDPSSNNKVYLTAMEVNNMFFVITSKSKRLPSTFPTYFDTLQYIQDITSGSIMQVDIPIQEYEIEKLSEEQSCT